MSDVLALSLKLCKAILTFHAALELSVIQPVFILPYLRVQLTNQHNVSDLTWQVQ